MKMLYYFIDSDGITQGPVTLNHFKENHINGHSWVWHEGLPQWVEAHTVPSLRSYMRSDLPISFSTKKGIVDFGKERIKTPNAAILTQSEMDQLRSRIPKSWLIESILVTVFCCVPFGIVGIVYASRVATYWRKGFFAESLGAAKVAAFWVKLSVSITILIWVIYALLWIFTPLATNTVNWVNQFFMINQY